MSPRGFPNGSHVQGKLLTLGRSLFPQRPTTKGQRLFLRLWCRRRLRWGCRLRLGLRGLHTGEYRVGVGSPALGENRKRDRSYHEKDRRPRCRLGQSRGGSAGTECCLAAHATREGSGDVAALAALQQYDDNEEQGNNNVNNRNECNEHVENPASRFARSSNLLLGEIGAMVRKGGFEPPRLSAPPPQDGVSASSTTSAGIKVPVINNLAKSWSEGLSDCTGFCTDLLHSTRPSGRAKFPSRPNSFSTASSRGCT